MSDIHIEDYTVHMRKISELKPAAYNPRGMTKKERDDIIESFKSLGFVIPIIVNQYKGREDVVVNGHQRIKVMKSLKQKVVPCIYVNYPLDLEREANIRFNKNTGHWKSDMVFEYFKNKELIEWGWNESELPDYEEPEKTKPEREDFGEGDDIETTIKEGDLIAIGQHRILCGDSTRPEDVDRLMDGSKIDMVFTDPPYALFGNSTGVAGVVDDKMVMPFFRGIFKELKQRVKYYGHIYVCCDWHSAFSLQKAFQSERLTAKQLCIWDKGDGGLGTMYQNCHEMIWLMANTPLSGKVIGKVKTGERLIHGKPNIWRHGRATASRLHTAQKPLEMVENAIKNSSDSGDLVVDLFLGSGTTIAAAHNTGRICYGMESEPKYCQVIIDRLKALDPDLPVLINGKLQD